MNLSHTWYEGIQACKGREAEVAVVQKLQASQPRNNGSSDDVGMDSNSKIPIMTVDSFASAPAKTDISMPVTSASTVPADVSTMLSDLKPKMYPKEGNVASNTTARYPSVEILAPHSTISPVNGTTITVDNPKSINMTHRSSSNMLSISSHVSASTPIIARDYGDVMKVVTHITIMFIIFQWC